MIPLLPVFYFGTVEHYRVLAHHPKVIIDIGEHYERQSYRTRTSIVGPNGKQDLVVQIARKSGEKMPMRSVGLSYAEGWQQQHIQAIRSAYGNTPWFIHYIDEIEAVVLKKHERLVDLDLATMRLGMKWLGLGTEVVVSEDYVEVKDGKKEVNSEWSMVNGEERLAAGSASMRHSPAPIHQIGLQDFRTSFNPKRPLPAEFPATPAYPQIFADRHGFVPRMSVIDLVMNAGPEARRLVLT